jgi:hypothetical protein
MPNFINIRYSGMKLGDAKKWVKANQGEKGLKGTGLERVVVPWHFKDVLYPARS